MSSRRQISISLGGRYRQVSLYHYLAMSGLSLIDVDKAFGFVNQTSSTRNTRAAQDYFVSKTRIQFAMKAIEFIYSYTNLKQFSYMWARMECTRCVDSCLDLICKLHCYNKSIIKYLFLHFQLFLFCRMCVTLTYRADQFVLSWRHIFAIHFVIS